MNARTIVRVVLVLLVLVAGIGIFKGLTATEKKASRDKSDDRRTLVEVVEVDLVDQPATIEASGTVIPARQVLLAAEVGGRVVKMSPKLIPGGFVKAKEQLLRIDARDYKLAMQQQDAQVNQAQTELMLERGRRRIAEREWDLLGKTGATTSGPPATDEDGQPKENLALREPQMRSARAALQAAESGLERARLAVGKTALTVPFNAMVQVRNVDVGQLVAPGASLATLVGTDTFWVQVAIPVGKLAYLDIPGIRGASEGSTTIIRQRTGEGVVERTGKVVRMLADLDPAGRMARVLVEIDDPLGLKEPDSDKARLPLLVGAYVEVEIRGHRLNDVAHVPRNALRSGNTVYVMTPDKTLDIKELDIAWRQRDYVLAQKGLAEGDLLVTTPIAAPVEGMKLKRHGEEEPTPAEPKPGAGPVKAAKAAKARQREPAEP